MADQEHAEDQPYFKRLRTYQIDGLFIGPGTNLNNADLASKKLPLADLKGASLSQASLENTDLSEACLAGARLTFATLSNANLKSADLEEADLVLAHLRNSDLTGANLTGAKIPSDVRRLAGAKFWGAQVAAVRNQKTEHADDRLTFSERLPLFLKIKNVKQEIQKLLSTPPTTSDLSFSTFILKTLPPVIKAKMSIQSDLSDTRLMCGDDTTLALVLIKSCPKEEYVPDLAEACASQNPQEWLRLWDKAYQKPNALPQAIVVSQSGPKPSGFFARIFSRFTERNARTLPSAPEQKLLPPGGPAPGT